MPPGKRVISRYPKHIDPKKLPPNVTYDPRGRGRWIFRNRKLNQETRIGDSESTVSELWSASDALIERSSATFRTISETFQESPAWKKLSPKTQKDYKNCHAAICDRTSKSGAKAGDAPVEAWTKVSVTRWMDARGVESKSRMEHEFRYLKRVFRWAMERDYATEDPTKGVRLEQTKKKGTGRYVTDQELRDFIILAPVKIGLLALLGYLTGRRKTDLLYISKAQETERGLEFADGESKTGKATYVEATNDLTEVLSMLKEEATSSTMIVNYKESSFDTAWQRVRRSMKDAGKEPFKFQDLRAKYATDLDEMGIDATRNLVHSSPALTQAHYLRKARKVVSIR
jgi:integrase